ncbi:MAG: hypothetical protein AMS27_14380 [Bacteroides sp. SM23_62_1]|nr:MAG: hypothetical protein AMS27_14380 [Bacteroides sp. SM23_62_1]
MSAMKDEIIISYLKNELSEKEIREVNDWIAASEENKKYFNRIKFLWENSAFDYQSLDISSAEAWDRIQSAITRERIDSKPNIRIDLITLRRVAAVMIVLISVGFFITWIIRQDRTSDVEWITANTTTGINEAILPDKSHIWLNNDSEIKYPVKFKEKTREIFLTGEAFFEVNGNKKKPFIIHAGTSEIRVLGTSFNVKSGRTTPEVIVTVVSGKVSLCDSLNREYKVILEPGDQGINSPDKGGLIKEGNDDPNFQAWKTGILIFDNTSLKDMCNTLSGYYNRPFVLNNEEIPGDKRITATFDNKDITEILKILEITLDISTRMDNDTIMISAN